MCKDIPRGGNSETLHLDPFEAWILCVRNSKRKTQRDLWIDAPYNSFLSVYSESRSNVAREPSHETNTPPRPQTAVGQERPPVIRATRSAEANAERCLRSRAPYL